MPRACPSPSHPDDGLSSVPVQPEPTRHERLLVVPLRGVVLNLRGVGAEHPQQAARGPLRLDGVEIQGVPQGHVAAVPVAGLSLPPASHAALAVSLAHVALARSLIGNHVDPTYGLQGDAPDCTASLEDNRLQAPVTHEDLVESKERLGGGV